MSSAVLTKTQIREGVWEGLLTGVSGDPSLEVEHLGRLVPGVIVQAVDQGFAVRVPIPADVLMDGVQTFLIRLAGTTETLAHFTIVTGVAVEDDLRAEIDLLRAELDMLKRAFRRHCVETMG
jgi:predicted alpha/beta-hydrolase family hydrolase